MIESTAPPQQPRKQGKLLGHSGSTKVSWRCGKFLVKSPVISECLLEACSLVFPRSRLGGTDVSKCYQSNSINGCFNCQSSFRTWFKWSKKRFSDFGPSQTYCKDLNFDQHHLLTLLTFTDFVEACAIRNA